MHVVFPAFLDVFLGGAILYSFFEEVVHQLETPLAYLQSGRLVLLPSGPLVPAGLDTLGGGLLLPAPVRSVGFFPASTFGVCPVATVVRAFFV